MSKSEKLPCTIHQSLVRPILLAGGDRTLVLTNLTLIVMLIFGAGIHWSTIFAACFLAIIGPPFLLLVF